MDRKYCQDYTDVAHRLNEKECQKAKDKAFGVALLLLTVITYGFILYDAIYGAQ